MTNFSNVLAILGGGTLVVAGIVGATWWIFQTLSKSWLDAKFNERLEAYKLAGAVEIARFQFTINAKLDRATKLHAHEFEVLPKAYDMLCAAAGAVDLLITENQQHPDLSAASDHDLNALLAGTTLSEADKAEVRNCGSFNRQATYIKVKLRHQMTVASAETQNLHNYLASKSIFIEPVLREQFFKASRLLGGVVALHLKKKTAGRGMSSIPGYTPADENRRSMKALELLLNEIRELISDRLWDKDSQQGT